METVAEFLNKLASKGVKLSADAGQLNCYAQKGALTADIRDGILKYRSEIIALFEGRKERQKPTEFPLSAGQKGLYILQKLHPEMSAYNVPLSFRIRSEIRVDILAKAWDCVLDQYPILTARVIEKEGDLYHSLDDGCKTTIQQRTIDFADDRELLSLLEKRAKEPFDLNRGPLTRIELFTEDQGKSILLLTVHHLIFDGTSAMILLKSLFEFYQRLSEGKPVRLSHDLAGYQEFVEWEEAMLASGEGAAHASYWQQQLDGELPITELLPDLPRPASPSFEGKTLVEELPAELSHWVHDFSRAHSLPPSVIFLAVFQLLLHRYTNQDDIIVGMPVMGRAAQKFAGEVGYFVNMVPIRTRCEDGLKLSDFFRKVQGTMLDALYHSRYPFPLMLEKLKSKQVRKNPVFQITYAYQNFVNQSSVAPLRQQDALKIESVVAIVQEGESDLGLEVFEHEKSFIFHLKYNPDLYTQSTARRFIGHYRTLLREICDDQDLLLHEYPIVPDEETHQLLVDFNDTRVDYPNDKCLHELFVEQAMRNGEKTAVVCGDQHLTYQQFYVRSHDLALYLQSQGVQPDSLVGLCMERSLDMLVGLLGILQAGAAYVPLDPDLPNERLAYMLQDSQAAIVLTQEKLEHGLSALAGADTRLIAVDRQRSEIEDRVAELKANYVGLRQEVQPHHLAYVIYTSGSTGNPKGVEVTHRSVVNLLCSMRDEPGIAQNDTLVAVTTLSFDIAALELYLPLCVGARIVVATREITSDGARLLATLRSCQATMLQATPVTWRLLLEAGWKGDPKLTVLCGGEALPRDLANQLIETGCPVWNMYGPTETTIWSSTSLIGPGDGLVPLGFPISNTQIYILDQHNNPQPTGVPGELHIAGDGLARGYRNRPELTQQKFVANPFQPGTRMYKTGDLARWLDDGNIQYLGRIDTQVKIRGFRIELGEIEARLNQHPDIQDSAVIAHGQEGNSQLIAFYRAKDTQADQIVHLPYEELRAHLVRMLPDYMVPVAFVSLAAIPLNPNGKVDRRALARMDVTIGSGQDYAAPGNDTERQLVEIWAEVLNLATEKIGVNDNFFELGGHSLLATRLISKIRSRLDIDLPLKAVFERPAVAQLAEFIVSVEKRDIPPIRPVDRATFDRLPLSFAQERIWFFEQLEPDSNRYNGYKAVVIHGELDIDQLDQAFNLIIARHENLRTVFPSHEGQAQQQILDTLDFKLDRIDLSPYKSKEERDSKARQLCHTNAMTPFDLAQGPLIRGSAIKLAAHEHILMLNMHHIVSDGWSIGVLMKELGLILDAFREGRRPELPPLPIQYVDYSVWQRKWLEERGILQQQLAYWRGKLSGLPESFGLPTDYSRPTVQDFAGATQDFALDVQLTRQLKSLIERKGGTLYMILLAALKVLLYRYTGQSDLCVGTLIANRQYGETEGLIGMFVNTLALRSQVEGEDTFAALFSQVKATCLEAYEHQDTPFEKVVDMLRSHRNAASNPIFQVMVILQNAAMDALDRRFPDYPIESGISEFDLTVQFTETPEGLAGSIEYRTALYKPQTIARMAEHFVALCRAITARPTTKIRDLDYVGDNEKHRLLVGYNDTRADYPKDKCIHQMFAEQVAIHPDKTAAVFGEQQLTYQQLYDKSRDLALYLQSQGVQPDSVVGLCVERSLDMMVGILGIVQAGAAYLPADPSYPDDRLAYMLQDSQAAIVLTQEKFKHKIASLLIQDAKLITLDKQWSEISKSVAALKAKRVELSQDVAPRNLCYVIYTSGSTGKPKGVLTEHQALVNRIHWMQKSYRLDDNDVVLQKTPYSFDVSVWEFFWPMMAGASVVFAVPDGHKDVHYLEHLINKTKVTTLHFVPSMLHTFLDNAGVGCSSVKQIFCSGEALDRKSVDRYKTTFPNATLHNLYGPTEAAIDVTAYDCSQLNHPFVPIGRPIDNTQIYILDPYNHPQPIGIPGELHIAGDGLARGYLNRSELTQEKFVANPFEPGTRMYKTGDLARWLDDGNIQHLGHK